MADRIVQTSTRTLGRRPDRTLDGKTGLLTGLLTGKQDWKCPVDLLATCCGSKSLKVILIDSDFRAYPVFNPLVTLILKQRRRDKFVQNLSRLCCFNMDPNILKQQLARKGLSQRVQNHNQHHVTRIEPVFWQYRPLYTTRYNVTRSPFFQQWMHWKNGT